MFSRERISSGKIFCGFFVAFFLGRALFCVIEHHMRAKLSRRRRLLGNVVALGLEAVLVGDVVERDDLTIRGGPAD